MFDDLMLLSEGHCVYFGPAEGVLDYFEKVRPVLTLLLCMFPIMQ
jgi:hypothetical protein